MSAGPVSPSPAANPERASTARLEQPGASDISITDIHQQLLREKPEPREGFSPIPIFILFIFAALIFYGGIYLGTKSGNFSPMAFDISRDYAAEAKAPKQVAAEDPMKLGARLYGQTCVACHQPTGQGQPPAFPPLAASDFVTGNEERLIRIIANGLTGPVEVNGQTYNGAMPAFHGAASPYKFNENRIAAVLTFVRASFGNSAQPITPEKVKEVLGAIGNRANPWTAPELEPFK